MKRAFTGVTIGAAMGIVAVVLTACGSGGAKQSAATTPPSNSTGSQTRTLTTRGVGKVSGVPDTVTLVVGVQTRGATAQAALSDNNVKASALIATLKAKGVASKDLQTIELSVQPNYDQKGLQITGYTAADTVRASIHNLSGAGTLIDAAAASVGNAVRVQQISFSIGDSTALLNQARTLAVQQAHTQASLMTQAAGMTLDRVRTIAEVADVGQPTYYGPYAATAAASVPLQAGTQQLSVSVDITYDIS